MNRPADEPQFHVGENSARPGLVLFSVATGTDPFSITPERRSLLCSWSRQLLGHAPRQVDDDRATGKRNAGPPRNRHSQQPPPRR